VRAGEIWAGTDDGLIQLTRDEGKSWEDVTPKEITAWSKVTHMEASHFDAGTAYAAVDRHRLEDVKPYLYRTQDFGKSWKGITRGIPEGSFLNCVREDPVRRGLLYACTETGVYVSFNDGEDWQSLQLNLPVTSVRDLVVHENDLVVATFGRAFWILDDMTPLRQADRQMETSEAWLFAPETAYRARPGWDQGTPVPTDEALAENRRNGAVLDYYLKEKSATPVQLEIFDAEGKLVRRFASDDKLTATKPESLAFTMNWVHEPQPLANEAGAHRFVWDLHYALPEGVRKSYYLTAGPLVVPGEYAVKLTANGESSTQKLSVKMDPRVKATPEALQSQFALASQLSGRLGEVSAALLQANDLRKQIGERRKEAAGDKEVVAALEELNKKTEWAHGADGEDDYFMLFGLALPGAASEPLPRVDLALTGLLVVAESADVAPTSDLRKAVEAWDGVSLQALAQWKGVVEKELVGVNSKLEKAKMGLLVVK
jgi:hypothetical protein